MCGKQATTTSTSTPNPVAQGAYNNIIQQAQNVAQTPFVPYSGQFVAPLNASEQAAGANIFANAGLAQPYYQQAAQYANNAAQPIGAAQINQYLSPYTQDVVNATQAQLNQSNATQQSQLTGNAAAQDALGGNRVGLAQAALAGQQQLNEAPTIAGLYNQGYSQALGEANTEQQAQAQAAYGISNIGTAAQNAALTGAGAELGYGQLGQTTQQAQDTAQYQQFLAEQGFPFQELGWEAQIASGIGSQMGGQTVTQGPQPNYLNSVIGLGAVGAGLFGKDGGRINANRGGRIAGVAGPHYHYVVPLRRHGGRIAGFALGGTPYASEVSYIPTIQIATGHTMPSAPGGSGQQQQQNPITQANQLLGLGKSIGKIAGNMDVSTADAQAAGLQSGLSPEEVGWGDPDAFRRGGRIAGLGGGYAYGGIARGYDDGGTVDEDGAPYQVASLSLGPTPGLVPSQPADTAAAAPPTPSFADPAWSDFSSSPLGGQPSGFSGSAIPSVPATPTAGLAAPAPSNDTVTAPSIAGGTAQPASQAFNGNLAGETSGVLPDMFAAPRPRPAGALPNAFLASPVVMPASERQSILAPGQGMPSLDAAAHAIGAVESGGSKNPYAEVGPPTRSGDVALGRWQVMSRNLPAFLKQAGLPQMSAADFLRDPQAQRQVFDTVFGGYMQKYGNFNDAASAWFSGRPMAAAGNSSDGYTTVPQYIAAANRALPGGAGTQTAGLGSAAMSFAPTGGGSAPSVATDDQGRQAGFGFNPFHLSDNARTGLIAAGLGMMASRSPWLGPAIGEGGLAGLNAVNASKKESFNEDLALKKLDQAAEQARQRLAQSTKQQQSLEEYRKETLKNAQERLEQGHYQMLPGMGPDPNDPTKQVPGSWMLDTKTGKRSFEAGVIQTPKGGTTTSAVSDETVKRMAAMYNIQGQRALTGIARDPQTRFRILEEAGRQDQEAGITPQQRSDVQARYAGDLAAQRTMSVSESKMGMAAYEAKGAIQLADGAINKIASSRTGFLPLNKLIEGFQRQTLNPDQYELMTRLQGIENTYAAVMSRGSNVVTDSARNRAHEMLSSALDAQTMRRVLQTMQSEIDMAIGSPEKMREFYRQRGAGNVAPSASTANPANLPSDARLAPDGHWYRSDPDRPGKYIRIDG